MSVATADLHKAINTAWDASGLDALFIALGGVTPILNDQEATPAPTSFPYCILEQTSGTTTDRMSGDADSIREVRDISVTFNIHAGLVNGNDRTPKEIAANLAEELMKEFGGHPTIAPAASITLDNGNHLITQYQTDYGVRSGDDEYLWVVEYIFRLDVPVMV